VSCECVLLNTGIVTAVAVSGIRNCVFGCKFTAVSEEYFVSVFMA
jgi:hypothetical protein